MSHPELNPSIHTVVSFTGKKKSFPLDSSHPQGVLSDITVQLCLPPCGRKKWDSTYLVSLAWLLCNFHLCNCVSLYSCILFLYSVYGFKWQCWFFVAAGGIFIDSCGIFCCGMWTQVLKTCGILVPPPGMEPVSPALQGRFLTEPPGESHFQSF